MGERKNYEIKKISFLSCVWLRVRKNGLIENSFFIKKKIENK